VIPAVSIAVDMELALESGRVVRAYELSSLLVQARSDEVFERVTGTMACLPEAGELR
jgi:glutamine cyclotransferase